MMHSRTLKAWLFASALSAAACAQTETPADGDRAEAIAALSARTGGPVTVEANEAGTTRVLTTTPGFPVAARASDPAQAAAAFLADHAGAFQLAGADGFVAEVADVESRLGVSHVNLQHTYNGIPVFEGGIQILMDAGNNVVRATADERYRTGAPNNRLALTPGEAATAVARSYGLRVALDRGVVEGQKTTFESPALLDPVRVEPRIFQVAPGDDRYAYQVQLSWLDDNRQQQYQLALVDAQTGDLLFDASLVTTFTGRVFTAGTVPKTTDTTDRRVVVSFDGTAANSPSGWVTTPGNKTIGNNAIAATDLNANNTVGTNETQPTANASNSFDFTYSPSSDASNYKAAAVTNAFYYVNDFHDRMYALGWTETARNFQTSNFGKGGAQNDAVNVDAQDGGGTNNANFATPTDGSKPRMQMYLFTLRSGSSLRQDGDFDGSVVYHENAHGLSNRLVGSGTGTCLSGLQSGGMGEGWGDFLGSSFRNDPVVGAYVTGNNTVGIRQQSMANSTWTYNHIKNGTLNEVHSVGELWAAVLWDIRKTLGAAVTEQLVVQGLKNTGCNPSMLTARDGILAADVSLYGSANKCVIWKAFAGRLMGSGASSPNHNSTSAIVTSTAVPSGC